jgi:hypothetical protein
VRGRIHRPRARALGGRRTAAEHWHAPKTMLSREPKGEEPMASRASHADDISASIMCCRPESWRPRCAPNMWLVSTHSTPTSWTPLRAQLTFGPDVAAAARQVTDLPMHIHLMVTNPGAYVERFAELVPPPSTSTRDRALPVAPCRSDRGGRHGARDRREPVTPVEVMRPVPPTVCAHRASSAETTTRPRCAAFAPRWPLAPTPDSPARQSVGPRERE